MRNASKGSSQLREEEEEQDEDEGEFAEEAEDLSKSVETSLRFLNGEYDMDRCPPDLELARKHERANRIGRINVEFKKVNQSQICECCFFPIADVRFPMLCNRRELAYLGPGLTLFLEFMHLNSFLVLAICLVSSIPTLILNAVKQGPASGGEELVIKYSMLSSASKGNYEIREYLTIFLVPVLFIVIQKIQKTQKSTLIKCDESLLSPSDYTLMFIGLPIGSYTVADVKECVERSLEKLSLKKELEKPFCIEKVVLSYDIGAKISELRSLEKMQASQRKKLIMMRASANPKMNEKIASEVLPVIPKLYTKDINQSPKAASYASRKHGQSSSNWFFQKYKEKAVSKSIDCAPSPISKGQKAEAKGTSKEMSFHSKKEQSSQPFKTSGVVFVTLNLERGIELFEKRFKMSNLEWYLRRFNYLVFKRKLGHKGIVFKNNLINVKRAPEPSDVLWENLAISNSEIVKRRLQGYFLTFLMICFSFFLVTTCTYLEGIFEANKETVGNSGMIHNIIKVIKSLVIFLGNEAVEFILEKVTRYEKHKSLSSFNANLFGKIFKVQYLNTIFLIPLSRVFLGNFYKDSKKDIWLLYLTVMVLQPIYNLLDPRYIAFLIRKRAVESSKKPVIMTQKEANKLFQGPSVNITRFYVQFFLMISFTFFYTSLIPLLSLFSLVLVPVFYFAAKYEILRRNSRPVHIGNNINLIVTNYLQLIPLQFVVVENLFIKIIEFENRSDMDLDTLGLISIVIALSLRFVPWSLFLGTMFRKPFNKTIVETSYKEVCLEFENDYDRANPVTKKEALKRWIEGLDMKRKEMMGSQRKRRDAVKNLIKLKKYGLMIKAMCNNVENALMFYVNRGPKNQFRFQNSEALQTIKMNTLIKYTKTIKSSKNSEVELQNSNECSIFEVEVNLEDKLRELINTPKFIEPLDRLTKSTYERSSVVKKEYV